MNARAGTSAFLLALLIPIAASAQHQGGGGHGGAPGASGGAPRAAAPRAPVARVPAPQSGGFNLDRDINAPPKPAAVPARTYNPPQNSARPNGARPPVTANRNRPVVVNPRYRGQRAWTWNRGVAWAAAPAYWGGGFWGPFALGTAAAAFGAILYGTFADPATNQVITSYQVAPGSAGAELLSNYQLTQTPCGPPNLVVIFGPDNSVICAEPSNLVEPGEYDLDPSNLTLVSQ